MAMVKVCSVKDVPVGSMKGFSQNGKNFLVANAGGKLCAMDSTCTHRGGPLQEGSLEDGAIQCPLHGSRFDCTTGQPINPPAKAPVKVYPLNVQGDDVLVDL